MRLAIISDIHANYHALTSVLSVIGEQGCDMVVCCGDVVGYGGDPELCVDLVRAHCAHTVLGNHDLAVANGEGLEHLPPEGRQAARVHSELLDDDRKSWLGSLPDSVQFENVSLVHATPDDPRRWGRISGVRDAQALFERFQGDICFMGHTHRPAIMSDKVGVFSVGPGRRFLVNVGSVGQPRDGDRRAAVAFFDTASFEYQLVRVPYDIGRAARRILDLGLSATLAERLVVGQ